MNRVLALRESLVNGEKNLKRLKARAEETGEILLDVRVMEELLAYPHLIPEEWKNSITHFWGTIFRDAGGARYVAYLVWIEGGWSWSYTRLELDWRSFKPAAVLRK